MMNRLFDLASMACALLLLLVVTAATNMGGFELRAEKASIDGAVLQVQAFGCHYPEQAKVVGTAEGIIDGTRHSVPLKLKTSGKGVYVIVWERPAEGDWVLAITGRYRGLVSSLIVEVDDQGQAVLAEPDRYGRRVEPIQRLLTKLDVEQALEKLAYAG